MPPPSFPSYLQPRQGPNNSLKLSASGRKSLGMGPAPALAPAPNRVQTTRPQRQPNPGKPGTWDPNARLYHVTVDPKSGEAKHVLIDPKDIKSKNAHIFINGIANNPAQAAKIGSFHVKKPEFYMIHNPTHGIIKDLGESAIQKLGFRTKVADSTRDLLRHFDLPSANVTAHSQGTMIMNSALGDLRKQGKDMRGMNLRYHGAAANNLLSGALANRIGAHIPEFKGHALDPVHNIVGMNTLNPLRIAGSLLGAGLLFSKDPNKSSHTKPPEDAKRLGPIFNSHLFNPLAPTRYP
ncbi:MAG: type secretion protein Rhs [Prosthecobacter sp.]|nr:type secretion protein Rhs [Prosthecobacter sp.]